MTPMRRRLRKARFALMSLLTSLLVVAAVAIGLAQLALPWLVRNPQQVEAWLSERAGREVRVGHVQATWTRAGPRIVLDEVRIAAQSAGGADLELARAELVVNLYAAFQRNRSWNEFRLVGLDLELVRAGDGIWAVRGLDLADGVSPVGSATDTEPERGMGALGALVFADLRLTVIDDSRQLRLALRVPELRVVNQGRVTRVLGRVGMADEGFAAFSLVADIDIGDRAGRMYVGGRELDLARVSTSQSISGMRVESGRGDVELWIEWQGGRVADVRTRIDLGGLVLAAVTPIDATPAISVLAHTQLERIAMFARWRRTDDGWNADLADMQIERQGREIGPARLSIARSGLNEAQYTIAANALDIGAAASLAMLSDQIPPRVRRWLYLANPQGEIAATDLRWTSRADFDADARVDDLVVRSVDLIPGIDPLAMRMRGDAQGLIVEMPQQATRIDYPRAFRKPFVFSGLGGDFSIWPDADDWRIQTPRFVFEGEDYAGELRASILLQADGSRPVLDASALVTGAGVGAAKLFWPIRTMPENARNWLDRALVEGRVIEGRVVVRGDLDNWPFVDNSGRFEASARLGGLTLDYLPDWPAGQKLDVLARFINNGMHATASGGTALDLRIDAAEATIPSFRDPVLALSVNGAGTGGALLEFLRASPVGRTHEDSLRGLRIGGTGKVAVRLDAPLKRNDSLKLDGSVDLVNADLEESSWDLRFAAASGRVKFGTNSVAADELAVALDGRPLKLGVHIGTAVSDPVHALEARLSGTLPVTAVFDRVADIRDVLGRFPGEAHWDIALGVGSSLGDSPAINSLRLQSDLRGIAIELPAPLAKTADAILPFTLDLRIPPGGSPFSARLGEIVHARGQLPGADTAWSAVLDFGGIESTTPPPANGVLVAGRTEVLDAGAWIALLGGHDGVGGVFRGLGLDIGALRIGDRSFSNVRVDIATGAEETTVLLDGESLAGELRLPIRDELMRRGITAQFERVHWPEVPPGSVGALPDIVPGSIPPLHLWTRDLRFGTGSFGEARFESSPDAGGMRIDLLETKSPHMDMRAAGSWTGNAADNRSHMRIDMTAQSLGRMLDALGYAGIIDGGATIAHIDANWKGGPAAFALAELDGTLEISVDKGRILDVDPGAGGRLFGLLSLREIPRRLSLDFSDLFKSGMSFNSIDGTFQLRDGNAYTDKLQVNSPAAEIAISGRTGLRDRDYDQQMVVTPRAGATLPVVGALAGGPVGAAAGLVVQGLVGRQLNQAARSRYQVTGGWDKPVISLLARDTPRSLNPRPTPADEFPAQVPPEPAPELLNGRR